MIDTTTILVNNLTESLRQVTNYITVGLATAVSAFVLDRRSPDAGPSVSVAVPGVPVAMGADSAKLLLLGICFVAGAMASYATEGAERIVNRLQASPDILSAACTYASVATAPVGVRIIAAALPLAFVVPVMWRVYTRVRKVDPGTNGLPALLAFFVPYGALGVGLVQLHCRA